MIYCEWCQNVADVLLRVERLHRAEGHVPHDRVIYLRNQRENWRDSLLVEKIYRQASDNIPFTFGKSRQMNASHSVRVIRRCYSDVHFLCQRFRSTAPRFWRVRCKGLFAGGVNLCLVLHLLAGG